VLEHWRKAAARLPAGDVLRGVDLLGDALIKLREGREERLMLELAMIKLTRPETSTDAEAMLSRMDRLERKINSISSAPVAAPVEKPAPVSEPSPAPAPDRKADPVPEPVASPAPDLDEQLVAAAAPLAGEPDARSEAEGLTIEKFRSVWPQLFGGLRDLLGARRWALFRETEPMDVRGSTLVVGVRHGFHLKSLEADPAAASIVATRAGDLLGGAVEVVFAPADGSAPAGEEQESGPTQQTEPETEPERVPDQDQMDEAPADLTDPFKLIEDELGGTVVDESDGDG
jgi:hypothetical protein